MPGQKNVEYVASMLFGMNPRLPLAQGKAFLKIEPAKNTKMYYTRKGEKAAVEGVIGAAIVVHDPEEVLEFDEEGRLRLRVVSAAELRRFAHRLLEYADVLDLANALGVDFDEAARLYFEDGRRERRRGRRPRRRGRRDDEEDEEADDIEEEEVA